MAHKKQMSLDALSHTPEFKALSIRQALFVQTWCQQIIDLGEADPAFTTKAAYDAEGETARTLRYELLSNKKIKAALKVFQNYGKPKREILLEDVKADIRASKPGSAARAKLREIEAKLIGGKTKTKRRS